MVSQMSSFQQLVHQLVQAHELEIVEATQVLTMKLEFLEAELQAIREHAVRGELAVDPTSGEVVAHKVHGRRSSRHKNDFHSEGRERRTITDEDSQDKPRQYARRRSRTAQSRCHSPSAPDEESAKKAGTTPTGARRKSTTSVLPKSEASEESPAGEKPESTGESVSARTEAAVSETDVQRPDSAPKEASAGDDSPKQQGRKSGVEGHSGKRRKSRMSQREIHNGTPQEPMVTFRAGASFAMPPGTGVLPFAMPSTAALGSTEGEPAKPTSPPPDAPAIMTDRNEQVLPPAGPPVALDTQTDLPGTIEEDLQQEDVDDSDTLRDAVKRCLSGTLSADRPPDPPDDDATDGVGGTAAGGTAGGGTAGGGSSSSAADAVDSAAQPAGPMPISDPSAPSVIKFDPQMLPLHNGVCLGYVPQPQQLALGQGSAPMLQPMKQELALLPPDMSARKIMSDGSNAPRMSVIGYVGADTLNDPSQRRTVGDACHPPRMSVLGFVPPNAMAMADMQDANGRRVTWHNVAAPGRGSQSSDTALSVLDDDDENKRLELHTIWTKMSRRSLCTGAMSTTTMHRLRGQSRQLSQDMKMEEEQTFADKCTARVVSRPGSYRRLAWDVIGMVLIGYDLVAIPLQVFDPPQNIIQTFMSWFTIVFWTLDIPSSFLVGFHSEGLVEMRLEKIARHYAKTWLTFDIAVITMDWLISVAGAISASMANNSVSYMRVGRALRFMRLFRLLRIMKVHGVLNDIIEMVQSESLLIVLGIAKLMVFIIVINHLLACFWYGVGTISFDDTWVKHNSIEDRALSYRYATSLHWSLTQFTPASMEVTPRNAAERFFTVSVIIFAMVTFSSFISSVTNATTRLRNLNSENVHAQAALRQYLAENKVSMTLMGRIWGSLNQLMNKSKRRLHEKDVAILAMLPWSLKAELQEQVYTPILTVHPFWAQYVSVDNRSCRKIYQTCLTEVSLGIGQEQFNTHQTANAMLFVLSGILSYSKADKPEGLPPSLVSSGLWVSEPVMWVKWKHNGQLLATTHGELLAMNIFKVHEVMENKENASRYAKKFVKFFKENQEALSDIWADIDIIADMVQRAFSAEPDEVGQENSLKNKDVPPEEVHRNSYFSNFMPQIGVQLGSRRPSILGKSPLGMQNLAAPTASAPTGSRNSSRRPSLWGAGNLFGAWNPAASPLNVVTSDAESSDSSYTSSSGLEEDDEFDVDENLQAPAEPTYSSRDGARKGSRSGSRHGSKCFLSTKDENHRSAILGCKLGTPKAGRSPTNSDGEKDGDLETYACVDESQSMRPTDVAVAAAAAQALSESEVKAETPVVLVEQPSETVEDMAVVEAD